MFALVGRATIWKNVFAHKVNVDPFFEIIALPPNCLFLEQIEHSVTKYFILRKKRTLIDVNGLKLGLKASYLS
jgi:hypothetical protein